MPLFKYLRARKATNRCDPFVIQEGALGCGKIGPSQRMSWAEEVYMPDAGKHETVGRDFNPGKIPLILVILFCFLSVLIGKTAWLQIVKGDYYHYLAEGNRIRIHRIEPKRGVIYDRNGLTLVRNKADFMLYLVPADLPKEESGLNAILGEIGVLIGTSSESVAREELNKIVPRSLEAYQPVFIAGNIDDQKAMALYLKSADWPGVVLTNKTQREYLSYQIEGEGEEQVPGCCHSLSHIMGYTGKINPDELEKFGQEYLPIDYIGKMGIEYFWENELKGESGKKQVEVDAIGKEKKILNETPPRNGNNLVLSLDLYAQTKLEAIMHKHLEKNGLSRASGIVINPQNGEILAMVNLPAYDNNAFARGISREEYAALINHPDHPLFNRSVSGEYPSGSTIKPVMAAAALEEGVITERTSFLSTGGIRIGQWFFPDWQAGGHGQTNVRKAIAQSVNTFFYYIGGGNDDFAGLGVDNIVEYGKLFGLGTQTGVDLAGEADGFLPTPEWKKDAKGERWYIGDTYHLAIGQGDLLVTPLQVAAYTAVFANGGRLYRPHFIRQVLDGDDTPIKDTAIEPVREGFITPDNIRIVREGMRQTVTEGSGRRLNSVPVPVAGKTGTAQWSSKKDTHAWFTGFAPYDNPELAFTILLEEGGEGSSTATPVVEEFLKWYFGEYKKPAEPASGQD